MAARVWEIKMDTQKTEQRTPEWFAARRGRVTASSVGAILGNSPYADRDDVMRRMVREWHGAEREWTGNVATEYGTYHEEGALAEYRMETGRAVEAVGFITREDWAGCSPDGLMGLTGGLEIKCPFGKRKMAAGDDFKTLKDQPHYHDQVQFSLWVCERAWWDFMQWSPNAMVIDTVRPDSRWRTKNLPRLKACWDDYMIERDQPYAQKHLDPKRIDIDTPELRQRLAEYDDLVESIELAEARRKELLAGFVEAAKDRDANLCGRNLTKVQRAGSIAYAKAVKDLLPNADLAKYRGRSSEYWVLK
jgi:putative phage-type endonuclease